jgi:DUF1365 family protein
VLVLTVITLISLLSISTLGTAFNPLAIYFP